MKTIICLNCQSPKEVEDRFADRNKYCSIKCQHAYSHKLKVELWIKEGVAPSKKQIRKYLINKNSHVCSECKNTEWNGKPITLEIEHKDGNSENNHPKNLDLLCPNCHSQTPTYKAKNIGNGRHARRLRYKEGKSY
jgi:5-methylcytosine-specific restriction endonuclease McrA